MNDVHRSVTRQSWGSRLRGSFRGILFGLLCVAAAAWFLFWNEGRAVQTYRALQEGGSVVESVQATAVLPGNEGKLIHFTGTARTNEILRDDAFNVSVAALHLQRDVQMYQWREVSSGKTEKKLGGGTETVTTYTYEKVWSPDTIDSNRFKEPAGHQNPGYLAYPSRRFTAGDVRVGAFRLPANLVGRITDWRDLSMQIDRLPSELRWKAHPYEGGVFVGRNPSAPAIGDLRVRFKTTPATEVSVVARQVGSSLEPYVARNGREIQLLRIGSASADAMFEGAQRGNRTMTWIFRLLGFLGMFFGFTRLFKPLSVMGDVIPMVGNAMETGGRALSFLLALGVSSVIIAVAWLYYRPLLAMLIFALAAACVYGIWRLLRRPSAPQAPATPPPPPR